MLLLEAHHIQHTVKEQLLFRAEHLQIHQGDRIGLVGRNGSGKTSLLHILAGACSPEEGTVHRHVRCGLLPQLKPNISHKSGGEITQAYIQAALKEAPSLLLADEPTTHLDTAHIEWLEKQLSQWHGAFIVVSHDRAFLDTLCTKIWAIEEGKVNFYKGNYSSYEMHKKLEQRRQAEAYETYERKRKQLEEALKLKNEKAERAVKKPKSIQLSEARNAKPYFAKKQKKLQQNAKAIETRLEKMEKVEKPRELPPLKMDLPESEQLKGRIIIRVDDLEGRAPDRLLWNKTSFTIRGGDKLAVVGPNGSGKTTFLRKLIMETDGVRISPAVKIGYFSQNLSILDVRRSILDNVSASSKHDQALIRTVLGRLHFFRDDVHKPVQVLSGGERVKVALAKVFLSEVNTLVMDEPTNFLDIEATTALESLLQEYEGTIVFVSHDRTFVEQIANRVLSINRQQIELTEGGLSQVKPNKPQLAHVELEERRLVIETKITEVLSRLSIEPSDELEREFQQLLAEKRRLDHVRD